MPVQIPPQSAAPHDEGSTLFNKPWYLAFNALTSIVNSLNSTTTNAGDDGTVTINGIQVTY